MPSTMTRRLGVLGGVAILIGAGTLAGCGDDVDDAADKVVDKASEVADAIAEKGAGAFAEGQWRCEAAVTDDGFTPEGITQDSTFVVKIADDGRFSFGEEGVPNEMSGTWSVDGLKLRVAIPWRDDGQNGFYNWTYTADAAAPTHLSGTEAELGGQGQELDIDFKGMDEIHIGQKDVEGADGPNYDLDATCQRTADKPGVIPPTVPPSNGD